MSVVDSPGLEQLLIRGGRLLDPYNGTDCNVDVRVGGNGKIAEVGDAGALPTGDARVIDASGLWVTPGFIDLHVHLREPGEEYKEDIATGSAAAVAGGFAAVVAMPNTVPPCDSAEGVDFVRTRGDAVGLCRVLPTGAITCGLESERLAPIAEMRDHGAVAITDDGRPVTKAGLMRSALEYAGDLGLPVMTHAENLALVGDGDMHEGVVSTRLGLRGIPASAEDAAVSRDVLIAEDAGAHLHICHVSTRRAVGIIRAARKRGARITGEAAPHHFALTDEAVDCGYGAFDTSAKMNPPLRSEEDRLAIIEGLRDGTLCAIATDHAPHSGIEKDVPFSEAANGVIGLQTALPLSLGLWRDYQMPLLDVIARLTSGPASVLGCSDGGIVAEEVADLTIIDSEATWKVAPEAILSKSKNTPFMGQTMRGKVRATVVGGRIVYASL